MNFASACQDFLLCKLNPNNIHILDEPRVLPCGSTVCLKCIKLHINNDIFGNCLCKNEHQMKDVDSLPKNVLIEGILLVNEKVGGGKMVENFKSTIDEFEGKLEFEG